MIAVRALFSYPMRKSCH